MITIEDCAAFCDADPRWVSQLARKESLGPIPAYAQAHALIVQSSFSSLMKNEVPESVPSECKAA